MSNGVYLDQPALMYRLVFFYSCCLVIRSWEEWKDLQGRQLCQSDLLSFLKGVFSKRKEFAPLGSKFFPFRVDPFSEEALYAGKQTGSHKSCLPCKKKSKINSPSRIQSPKIYLKGFDYYTCIIHIPVIVVFSSPWTLYSILLFSPLPHTVAH